VRSGLGAVGEDATQEATVAESAEQHVQADGGPDVVAAPAKRTRRAPVKKAADAAAKPAAAAPARKTAAKKTAAKKAPAKKATGR
jgi:hypothetical protein